MGLDQWLKAKIYVGGEYGHRDVSGELKFPKEFSNDELVIFKAREISEVSITIAIWRKANAIHNWFIENIQNGVDDCGSYVVTRDQIIELIEACKAVISGEAKPESLPTKSGFFFGSTEYNQSYMEDLKYTVISLEKILNDPRLSNVYFEYSSSW